MSDIGDVVNGLSGTGGGIVLAALVLVGVYFLFRQTFCILLNKIVEQSEKYLSNTYDMVRQISIDIRDVKSDIAQIKEKSGGK